MHLSRSGTDVQEKLYLQYRKKQNTAEKNQDNGIMIKSGVGKDTERDKKLKKELEKQKDEGKGILMDDRNYNSGLECKDYFIEKCNSKNMIFCASGKFKIWYDFVLFLF